MPADTGESREPEQETEQGRIRRRRRERERERGGSFEPQEEREQGRSRRSIRRTSASTAAKEERGGGRERGAGGEERAGGQRERGGGAEGGKKEKERAQRGSPARDESWRGGHVILNIFRMFNTRVDGGSMVVGLAVWVCLWGVVVLFALATVRRNGDWKDEKSLFRAAEAVCPRSAKVAAI
jgi:hypothetical protein